MIIQNDKLYRIGLFGQNLTRKSQVNMQSFVETSCCSAASVSLNIFLPMEARDKQTEV